RDRDVAHGGERGTGNVDGARRLARDATGQPGIGRAGLALDVEGTYPERRVTRWRRVRDGRADRGKVRGSAADRDRDAMTNLHRASERFERLPERPALPQVG